MGIATICGTPLAVLLYGRFGNDGNIILGLVFLATSFCIWYFNRRKQNGNVGDAIKQDIVDESVCTASGVEIDYSSLYEELTEKCNPSNLLGPYDANRVKVTVAIYLQLGKNKNNINELIRLRNRAIEDLGIEFSSQDLYEKLSQVFNPSNFMGENYDAVKLRAANNIYSRIQECKDDVIELEKIAFKYNADTSSVCDEEDDNEKNAQSAERRDDIFLYFFVGVFALLAGLAGKMLNQESVEQGNDAFVNQYSTEKFSISYPPVWEQVQLNVDSANAEIVMRIVEKRKDNSSFSPNINILVLKERLVESTERLAEVSHKQLIDANFECELIGVSESSLGGCDGSLLKQAFVVDGFKILQDQYIVKKEDSITFIITVSMDYDKSKIQEAEIDKILSSFIIK